MAVGQSLLAWAWTTAYKLYAWSVCDTEHHCSKCYALTFSFSYKITTSNNDRHTSGMGAVRPGILRVGYDGGGP